MIIKAEQNEKKERFILTWKGLLWGTIVFLFSILVCMLVYIVLCVKGVETGSYLIVVGTLEGAVGALTGGFIILQLKDSKEVETKENQIHLIEFYHSFITYWLDTDRMFIEHPECRAYFYDGKSLDDLDESGKEYQLIMAFAEYFDDLFRYSPAEMYKQMESFSAIPLDQIRSYIDYMETIMESPGFLAYKEKYRNIVNRNTDIKNIEIAALKNKLAELG